MKLIHQIVINLLPNFFGYKEDLLLMKGTLLF